MTSTTVSPHKEYRPVPFIKGSPIVGNLLEFVRDRLNLLQSMADQGDVVGMRFGRTPAILLERVRVPVSASISRSCLAHLCLLHLPSVSHFACFPDSISWPILSAT